MITNLLVLAVSPVLLAFGAAPSATALVETETLTTRTASMVDEFDCVACHYCSWDPEFSEAGGGISSKVINDEELFPGVCFYWHWCSTDCPPDLDQEDEVALSSVLDDGRASMGWIRANRERFILRVVDNILEVARECGRVLAWVPLRAEEYEAAVDLLSIEM